MRSSPERQRLGVFQKNAAKEKSTEKLKPRTSEQLQDEFLQAVNRVDEQIVSMFESDREMTQLLNAKGQLLWTDVQQKLIDATPDVSKAARMLYTGFIPKAKAESRKPTQRYELDEKRYSEKRLQLARSLTHFFEEGPTMKEGDSVLEKFLRDGVQVSRTIKHRIWNHAEYQQAHIAYEKAGLTIEEDIYNDVSVYKRAPHTTKISRAKDSAHSHIEFVGVKITGSNGVVLDVAQLLPPDVELSPYVAQLRSGGTQYWTPGNYAAVGATNNGWKYRNYQHTGKEVLYGDLTKKGSRLFLLHEIAHAWQDAHGIVGARTKFEMGLGLYVIQSAMTEALEGANNSQNLQSPVWKALAAKKLKDMFKEAESIAPMAIQYDCKKLVDLAIDHLDPEGNFNIKFKDIIAAAATRIDEEALKSLTNNFVREERDAWAHALRVLRFLRTRGLDLEPEIQTTEDFRNFVYEEGKVLGSYEKYMEEIGISIPGRESFVRPLKH